MSGGSFEYLCYADAEDIACNKYYVYREHLELMYNCLQELGRHKAAAETKAIIDKVTTIRKLIEELLPPYVENGCNIQDVWKAIEWKYSLDISASSMNAVLDKYEKGRD